MKKYDSSAQALATVGLTDTLELAARFDNELAARGAELVEMTGIQVINGRIWYLVHFLVEGLERPAYVRFDEDGFKLAGTRAAAHHGYTA